MHLQYARPAFFVLFAGLLFLGIPPCLLEAAPPVRIMPLPQVRVLAGSAEDLYARAKTEHERLEQNGEQAQSRDRWLACVRQFRRVQLMRKNEELTANSLFMQGRLYRQMFEYFRMPLDQGSGENRFLDPAGPERPPQAESSLALHQTEAGSHRGRRECYLRGRQLPDRKSVV